LPVCVPTGTYIVRLAAPVPPEDSSILLTLSPARTGLSAKGVRITKPANEDTLARSIVALSELPGGIVVSVFDAEIVKSGLVIVKSMRATWLKPQPPLASTVTNDSLRNALFGTVIVRVALAVPPDMSVTLVVSSDAIVPRNEDGERYTCPVNPNRLVSVIVEVVVDPSAIVMLLGVAEILKSGFVNAVVVTVGGEGIGETCNESLDTGVKWDGAGIIIRATMTNINPSFARVTLEDRDFEVRTIEYGKVCGSGILKHLAFARLLYIGCPLGD
jgi:hypothetical protein